MGTVAKGGSLRPWLCRDAGTQQNLHSANPTEVWNLLENSRNKVGHAHPEKKKNEICTSFIKTEFHLEFQATGLFPVEPFLIGEHETWYPEKVEGSEGWF